MCICICIVKAGLQFLSFSQVSTLERFVFLHKFYECFKGQWSWCIRDQELRKESLCIVLWLQKHSLPMAQIILQMKASVHADSQVFLMLALAGTVSVLILTENSYIEICVSSHANILVLQI